MSGKDEPSFKAQQGKTKFERDIPCAACHKVFTAHHIAQKYCADPVCALAVKRRAKRASKDRFIDKEKAKATAKRLAALTQEVNDQEKATLDAKLHEVTAEAARIVEAASQIIAEDFQEQPEDPRTLIVLSRRHEVLTNTILEEKRELGKESFWFFFTQVLFPKIWHQYYSEPFHAPICDHLQNLEPGSNHMNVLFREARKTYIVVLGFSLWHMIKNGDIRIMLVGAKE